MRDRRLVGEEGDAPIAEQPEDDAAGHLGASGEWQMPGLGEAHDHADDGAGEERRRHHGYGETEHRNDVGEDAGVVGLLEAHVDAHGIVLGHAAVELPEAHAEALGLVRLGRCEEPERPRVEPRLRAAPAEVPHVGVAVDRRRRADGRRREPGEEHLAPGQGVPREVRLAVARQQELPIAGDPVGAHRRTPERASRITSPVTTRSPIAIAAIAAAGAPTAATSGGTPLPITPPNAIMRPPFATHDRDRGGPATIDRRDHFRGPGRAGTGGGAVWYERARASRLGP